MGGRRAPRRQGFAGLSYPRRQQLRRLTHAAGAGATSALTVILAVAAAQAGLTLIAGALLLAAVASGLSARYWTRLAGRAAVGARSGAQVRRALAALECEGWRLRHPQPWQRGDIDHVAIAPTGIAFAIETKTRRYGARHLDTVRAQAAWLRRRRPPWCPSGAAAVLCLTRGHDARAMKQTSLSSPSIVCPQRCAWPPARSGAPPSWPAAPLTARAATGAVKTPRKAGHRTRNVTRVHRPSQAV